LAEAIEMTKYEKDIKKYRMIYDIHTHTIFSHGKGTIEDNVKVAVSKGLDTIGIADHGPGHIFYGIKRKDIEVMWAEIERLKPLYPNIEILLGVEANIINPSGRLDISSEDEAKLDYVLAGYHYGIFGEKPLPAAIIHLFNLASEKLQKEIIAKQKKVNTDLVIRALHENKIKVLTHPGDKGPFDIMALGKACQEVGTLMEISTWHEAPLTEELRKLATTDVRFIISSDAHSPKRVGTFEPGLRRALEAGVDPTRIENLREV
jgi:putative hydrolase